ncbi:hypothetical protein [Silanimonas sp.]|jgi:hypothetical protein|uniref:hypothetical protein n=1 Tax=Silanimonas sp. TaxID=1929290 RepID=UPI0022C17EFE|nr:hypothetical protein [Silanimonas sp.]MCZ8114900.1 hypothetical protein [Silanimonas sp.]
MSRRLIVLSVVSVVVLAGCASKGDVAANGLSPSIEERSAREGIDFAYMERQNRIAQSRGFLIKWVNPPRYRPDAADLAEPEKAD